MPVAPRTKCSQFFRATDQYGISPPIQPRGHVSQLIG